MASRDSSVARFGLLCEDETDADTLKVLVRRIAARANPSGPPPGIERRAKGGCGNLRKKAHIWARELVESGHDLLILVHDLDRSRVTNRLNDVEALQRTLDAIAMPKDAFDTHICIPIEELEAWFFACPIVMHQVAGKDGLTHPTPHNIERPKERLQGLSRGKNRKPRYSTNDNPKLAELLDLDACARACPSFRGFRDFVSRYTAPRGDVSS